MRSTQIITIGLFGTLSWAASAGELGPTSRGTVAISITVPPHISATSNTSVSQDPRLILSNLCVATNGLRNFHLMVVDPAGEERTIPNPPRGAPMEGICRGSGLGFQVVDDEVRAAREIPSASLPLTLLVVPD